MTASIPILPANILPPVSSSSLILQEGPWESRVDTTARKLCPQLPTLAAPGHSQVYGGTRQLVVDPWENGPEEESTTDNGSRLSTEKAEL